MASEKKATSLFIGKTSDECQDQKDKIGCSKSAVSWILAVVLLSLLVVLVVQFFYPPYEQKIRIYEEQPIELRVVVPPRYEDEPSYDTKGKSQSNPMLEFPWDFEFLIDPVDLCATLHPADSSEYRKNPEVKLLMLVPSAVDHFEQRRAIRKTWGSVAGRPFGPMRLGFVLGTTDNATLGQLLREESGEFKDIVQADLADSHLTAKSVLMLKWVASRCPHAQFFLKADDDTFVNVGAIARILGGEPYASREKFIGGHVKTDGTPNPPDVALYIDLAVDPPPPVDAYPPYASGSAYVMSVPTAFDLFDAAREVETFLPQEDAFLTGLCAQHAEVPLIHEPTFVIDDPPNPPSWDAYSTLATAHSVTPDILEQVWSEMTQSMADSLFYFESAINSTVRSRNRKNF